MKIEIGQLKINVSVIGNGDTFGINVMFPVSNVWVELAITKGMISKGNVHIEVNLDKEFDKDHA
jgi:hypothetical protein